MHNTLEKRVGRELLKACVQRVSDASRSSRPNVELSTQPVHHRLPWWKKTLLYPARLHTFLTQFSAYIFSTLPNIVSRFSPLSTALIISSPRQTKRILILRNGG